MLFHERARRPLFRETSFRPHGAPRRTQAGKTKTALSSQFESAGSIQRFDCSLRSNPQKIRTPRAKPEALDEHDERDDPLCQKSN